MAAATEGRTYIDFSKENIGEVRTHYVVPNGKWVMERPPGWAKLVGVNYQDLELLQYTNKYGRDQSLYVSDQPFGYVTAEDAEFFPGRIEPQLVGDLRFYSAQQIHKGELTQTGVPFPKLTLVRESPELARKHAHIPRNRDQKRNRVRWARLADLEKETSTSSLLLIGRFWRFIGFSVDLDNNRHGTFLHVVHGTAEDVASPDRKVEYYTPLEFDDAYYKPVEPGEGMWIRAGLAKTILQLKGLGVIADFF